MRKILLILLLFNTCVAHAQERRIVKGILTDPQTHAPIPGASILIKNTTEGTSSHVDGTYVIEAPLGSTLVISMIGMKTVEMKVTKENSAPLSGTDEPDEQKTFRHVIPDDPEKTLSPYFFVKSDNPEEDQLPLKSTSAEVSIAGIIADVKVSQVYVNTGTSTLEAVYIFPGSTRAAVYAMNMHVGERVLQAKIREKEQARQDYEEAKSQGKTATLLEQKRPNVFQMNVANILPGDTIIVNLHYTEALVPVDGTYEFVYPTVVGPRYSQTPDDDEHAGEQWVSNPYQQSGEDPLYTFNIKANLNTGVPLQKVFSPSHTVQVSFSGKSRAEIRLDEKESAGGNRDFILRYRLRGGTVESGLLVHPRNDENFFLLMVEPPEKPSDDQIPPREYIFVVDVSGSMMGFPIGVSKRLLNNLISSLRPTDRFNVMLFESSNAMLHKRSVPATEVNIREALQVLSKQQGGGGTNLYPALKNALTFPKEESFSRTFIVVTDGYVTIEKEAFNLIRSNLGNANLFAFGIGSSVNRFLIEGLAHAGMGEPYVITDEKEADKIGKKFVEFVRMPVLSEVSVKYEGFDAYDIEPTTIPDVFAERPIMVYGKYRGGAKGTIKVSGYSGKERWEKLIDVSSASRENNQALRYLWARNRIKYLDDYAMLYEGHGPAWDREQASAENVKKVTELGLKYNLLTAYTSFIAIDSVVRNPSGKQVRVKQPLPLPEGVSNSAIGMTVGGLSLDYDVQSLEEVVVVGYGVQRKVEVTGSVTSVNTASSPAGFFNTLQGKVSGVTVNENGGSTGASHTVRIRGHNSASSTNTPLYVVDGVVTDASSLPTSVSSNATSDPLAAIDPAKVQSIQVLKGPSATAVYGSRAANGVILITTKGGSSWGRNLELTSSLEIEKVNKLPGMQRSYAQGLADNGGLKWMGPETGTLTSWGPSLSSLRFDGSSYPYDVNGRLYSGTDGAAARAYDATSFFRHGVTFSNNLYASLKRESISGSFNVAHMRKTGVIPHSEVERIHFNMEGEKKWDRFRLSAGTLLSFGDQRQPLVGNTPSSVMYSVLTTPPSFDIGNRNQSSWMLEDGTQRSYSPGNIDNPYFSAYRNFNTGSDIRFIPSFQADVNLNAWLKLKGRFGGQVSRDKSFARLDMNASALPEGGFYDRRENYSNINTNIFLEGEKQIMQTLTLRATGGFATENDERIIDGKRGAGLSGPGQFEAASHISYIDDKYVRDNQRGYGKISLNWNDLLTADASSTLESTSTLRSKLHSRSIGLAFNFGNIPAIQLLNVFSAARISASAGKLEKEAPMFLDPNLIVRPVSDLSLDKLFPERVRYTSDNLVPEAVSSKEINAHLEFFNSRVSVSGSVFSNTTRDAYVPTYSSETTTLTNGAAIRNRGVELDLHVSPIVTEVNYTIGVNFTRLRSSVLSLSSSFEKIPLAGFDEVSSNLIAGQPYGVIVGSAYLRDASGRRIIGDDGFPLVDPQQRIIGDANPDWTLGFNQKLSWKMLTLEMLIDVRKGGDVWNGTAATMNYFGTGSETGSHRMTTGYIFNGVTMEGAENAVPVSFYDPALGLTANRWYRYGVLGVGEDAIEDGSFVRLRSIALTLNVSQEFAKRLGMKKLSFTMTGHNLWLLTNFSGLDPETSLTGESNGRGLHYFNMPNTRSYGWMIKVGL